MRSSTVVQPIMIVSYSIQPFRLNHQNISYKFYMGQKNQSLNSQLPSRIAYQQDAKMQKGFADSLSKRFPEVRGACRSAKLMKGQVFPVLDRSLRFIYNLVTKEKFSDKPDLNTLFCLSRSHEVSRSHIWSPHHCNAKRLGADLTR